MPEKECIHENDIEEMKKRDQKQDDNHAELKGYVQEISTHQQITHTDMEIMKKRMDVLEKKFDGVKAELKNGFAKKLVNLAFEKQQDQTDRLIDVIQNQSENNTETIQNQNKNNNSLLEKVFSKGGFAVAVITAIVAVIKLITG